MASQPSPERHGQLIGKYFIPNMGDNSAVGSDLSLILERLDVNHSLAPEDKQYIRDKGLFDLCKFVKNLEETGKADFKILSAKVEQREKKDFRRKLWEKFDIDFIESRHMRRMVELLVQVEKGGHLTEKDVLWLTTNDYFTRALKRAYHKIEALHFHNNFKKSNDPWQAVNASSHYRKADQSREALRLLDQVNIDGQSDKHLKAALCTTKGGANRDLKQFDEALQLAEKAHSYEPGSFHPCTLLGAVHYELGNHSLGNEWFAKAIERGANPEAIDHELRSIFMRADKAQKENLKQHLLKIDPARYSWVKRINGPQKDKHKTKLSKSSNRPR